MPIQPNYYNERILELLSFPWYYRYSKTLECQQLVLQEIYVRVMHKVRNCKICFL